MSDLLTFKISGIPTAWAAPFFTGKRGISPRFREKERAVHEILQQSTELTQPFECPVHLMFTFRMPVPSTVSKKKRIEMLAGRKFHCKRPDCSNLVKFAEDCLKGIIIKDDNQVFSLQAKKEYHEKPETIINVFLMRVWDAAEKGNEPQNYREKY